MTCLRTLCVVCFILLLFYTLSSVDCSAFFSLSSSNRHFWISSTNASPNWPTARVFSSALVIKPDRNLFLSSSRAILLILSRNDLWVTRSSSRFLTLDCVEFKTWGKQQSHEVYFLLALVSTHSCYTAKELYDEIYQNLNSGNSNQTSENLKKKKKTNLHKRPPLYNMKRYC